MNNLTYEIKKADTSDNENFKPYYVYLESNNVERNFWLSEFKNREYFWNNGLTEKVTEPEVLICLSIARDELLERGIINELE